MNNPKQSRHPKLRRVYRIVRPNEQIHMFDWFTSKNSSIGKMPSPDKQYNEGWLQITPDNFEGMLDGHPSNHETFNFARFVDCVPVR